MNEIAFASTFEHRTYILLMQSVHRETFFMLYKSWSHPEKHKRL